MSGWSGPDWSSGRCRAAPGSARSPPSGLATPAETRQTWCEKYSGRSTPSACDVPTFGRAAARADSPSPTATRSDGPIPQFQYALIDPQSGFGMANPLNMHNKWLKPQAVSGLRDVPFWAAQICWALLRALQPPPTRAITAPLLCSWFERNCHHGRCRQAPICPIRNPVQGRSCPVLRRGPEARTGRPQVAGASRRPVQRAAAADRFSGKSGKALDIVAPAGLPVGRLVILGVGKTAQAQVAGSGQARRCRHRSGSVADGRGHDLRRIRQRRAQARPSGRSRARYPLRGYVFDRYKTKRKEGEEPPAKPAITIAVGNTAAPRRPGHRVRPSPKA